jgi:hypothetical protein
MKRIQTIAACLTAAMLNVLPVNAQLINERDVNAIDLKLDLAETKLELLDSKIRLWEEKPAALEMQLMEIEEQVRQLSFSPEQFNEKFLLLDSMLLVQQRVMTDQQALIEIISQRGDLGSPSPEEDPSSVDQSLPEKYRSEGSYGAPQPNDIPPGKYVVSIYPIRIFEGTMQLSLEWVMNRGNAIELSAMATYAAKEGVANYYVSNQKLDYYNAALDSYVPYESENISGFGTSLAWRNYLLPRTISRYSAPRGAYAAPTIMYRRLRLTGFDYVFDEETGNTEQVEVEQNLNIFTGGVMAGWQFILWNAVSADVYVGGVIRLSKYDGDSDFTKYKQVRNIDFSGVMPTFGLKIGIVK